MTYKNASVIVSHQYNVYARYNAPCSSVTLLLKIVNSSLYKNNVELSNCCMLECAEIHSSS